VKIVIATIKPWNINNANKLKDILRSKKIEVFIITNKEEFNFENLKKVNPKYIFLPHWSWKIPKEIYKNFECIGFHITDLPFGRGGSPLQNLISRKIYKTKITAFRIEQDLDAGKIYLKKDFYIGLGSAEEIFITASEIIFFEMIPFILEKNPVPYEQKGKVVKFVRRKPEESNLEIAVNNFKNLRDFYDFIRMLDGEGYPKAFLKIGKFKILFSEVHMRTDKLVGRFEVLEDE